MIDALDVWEHDSGPVYYRAPYLTRDIYRLHVDILLRELTATQRLTAVAFWCAEFVENGTAVELLETIGADVERLAEAMVMSASLGSSILADAKRIFDIGTGADEYDASADDKVCTCVRCMGLELEVEGLAPCKFEGISSQAKQATEWSYLLANPKYLDAPFSMYQLAQLRESAIINGRAADRQKRDREREGLEENRKTREKYGHHW